MSRSALLLTLVLTFALAAGAQAFSLLNDVPAVSGRILTSDGTPIAGATVTVRLLGIDGGVLSEDAARYVIKELSAVTDADGVYKLEGCTVNLPKLKAKFIGAEIDFAAPGYATKTVQAINMRAMGGALGVFLIGMVDAQGEFDGQGPGLFSTAAHAYKTVKESKFSRVYEGMLSQPMTLDRADGASRRTEQFGQLYNE